MPKNTDPDDSTALGPDQAEPVNQVRLRGRVTSPPTERVLPSGTKIVTLRVSVPREDSALSKGPPGSSGSRQTTDWFDCSAWGAPVRRTVGRWREDDEVVIEGALRRRFFRTAGGAASILEVEVGSARLLHRSRRSGTG
jgi:single-strand DNA-binding protein